MLRALIYSFFRRFPIKRKKLLFIGYYGAQYGCNPKYISEYLVSHHSDDVDVVWAFTDPDKHVISGIQKVRFGSVQYLKMLATCRVIVSNYRLTTDFKKRSDQVYIQTWHSSLRLKKIEGDAEEALPEHYVKMAKHDSAQTDYVIAGCQMSHKTFAESFWYNGAILDIGTPRNDVLFYPDLERSEIIKKRLNIEINKRIVLYAPTFRKNNKTDCYNLDISHITSNLSSRFGGDWVVLLRLHPHLVNCELFKGNDDVIDVTRYDDIQELLMISDVLISDFSSLIFDFAISNKPVFLYAADFEEYCRNDRSLYFNIDELPFSIATSNNQLSDNIKAFDYDNYKGGLAKFNKKVGSYEDGTASSLISQLIIEMTKK